MKVKCEPCGREYRSACGLRRHVDAQHLKLRFGCPACGESGPAFLDVAELRRHYKQAHPAAMPLAKSVGCPFDGCGEHFDTVQQLVAHQESAHDGATFDCRVPNCRKRFDSDAALTAHQSAEHPQRPFRCPWRTDCGRAYPTQAALRGHLLRKHREAYYPHMTGHKRSRSSSSSSSVSSSSDSIEYEEEETGERNETTADENETNPTAPTVTQRTVDAASGAVEEVIVCDALDGVAVTTYTFASHDDTGGSEQRYTAPFALAQRLPYVAWPRQPKTRNRAPTLQSVMRVLRQRCHLTGLSVRSLTEDEQKWLVTRGAAPTVRSPLMLFPLDEVVRAFCEDRARRRLRRGLLPAW